MQRVKQRFNELASMAEKIEASKKTTTHQPEPSENPITGHIIRRSPVLLYGIDSDLFIQWQTSVLSLLERVFGKETSTFQHFDARSRAACDNMHAKFDGMKSVFLSAKDDLEGGYLFSVENLVHANVFANELEQAEYFLDEDYKTPAAVVAGSVLEATLRRLCESHDAITMKDRATLSWHNDELKRAAVYNQIVHKQVLSWAAIRNAAAHGHPDDFEPGQVRSMIDGIRDFIAKYVN